MYVFFHLALIFVQGRLFPLVVQGSLFPLLSVQQVGLALVYSSEFVPLDWICMSICTAGFHLVLQACLTFFDLYNFYI